MVIEFGSWRRQQGETLSTRRIGLLTALLLLLAGATVVLPAGTARAAFPAAAVAQLGPAVPFPFDKPPVKPGGTVDVTTLSLQFSDNASSHVWSTGDTITFEAWNPGSRAPLAITAMTMPSVSATNGFTGFTVVPSRSAASPVDNEFVLTLTQPAPLDSNTTMFTFSDFSVTLSSQQPLTVGVAMRGVASSGTPFAVSTLTGTTAASNSADAILARVAGINVVVQTPVVVRAGETGVALNPFTIMGYQDGDIASGDTISLVLDGGTWVTAPTASGVPSIGQISGIGTATLSFTSLAASQASVPLTLTGAVIDIPTDKAEVQVTLHDAGLSSLPTALTLPVFTTRVLGASRYETADDLLYRDFAGMSNLVLTSGINYPDALSAIFLAKQLSTGVMITDPNSLSPEVSDVINAHGVQTIYVVGGPAAVSDAVLSQITALVHPPTPIHVVRISGNDRYATNDAVDRHSGQQASTVVIATGGNYADALAAGPALYASGYPLVLVPPSGLGPAQRATLTALGATSAIILGGTNAISSDVEQQLTTMGIQVVQRIAGADRTQTASKIAAWETDGMPMAVPYIGLPSLGFTAQKVDLARGDSFADALVAGAADGSHKVPLLLTGGPTDLGPGVPKFLTGRASVVEFLEALGGTSAISDATLAAAAAALN